MKTDIPLKRLTLLRATDLIPLLGLPVASVQTVVIPELPMQKKYLDILLRVRSPQRQEYLHLLEWQGYFDAAALWRLASSMGLVGQDEPHMTIIGTIVYLKPADDTGDTLTMAVDGQVQHHWPFRCLCPPVGTGCRSGSGNRQSRIGHAQSADARSHWCACGTGCSYRAGDGPTAAASRSASHPWRICCPDHGTSALYQSGDEGETHEFGSD